MSMKTYRAIERGQKPNGGIAEPGEVFSGEFRVPKREVVREGKSGRPPVTRLMKDERGRVQTEVAKNPPSWAVEVGAKAASPVETEGPEVPEDAPFKSETIADPDFATKTIDELAELAAARGVYPEKGSGKDGAVIKKDLVAALEG